VPLMLGGHEAHEQTLEALDGRVLGLAGHAWFETFSVLTRLPSPARRSAREVIRILEHNFPESRFLPASAARALIERLHDVGAAGGAVYDVLVGAAAAAHNLPLVSRDQRAGDLYRALRVDVELIA
ncbi:MAG: PIN domain-containing protein, partial [Actinobacteria bacterium]|nr:PIN domain-containing protein [Actinomycetota bacterium]